MRPSADDSQRTREARMQDSHFRDDRDTSQRGFRNEQTEQQRLTVDWDAVAGSFSGEETAYNAYLNPEGSSEQYLVHIMLI